LVKYPAAVMPAPAAELVPEVQLIYVSVQAKTPKTFASESLATLGRAVNATNGNEKLRASALLYHAFLPLNRRRAERPEKFARHYAGISGQLADVMQGYLDSYLQIARHSMAVDFTSTIESQFRAVCAISVQPGADLYLLQVAGPAFTWPARA
jgi:hypothetical protein